VSAGTQDDAGALLARHGVRPTRQRLAVLDALAGEPNDATAQEIHARLHRQGATVGLATVYRTLGLLSDHAVIDALMHRPGEVCYRLCGEDHHHHLVCSRCHRVVEVGGCALGPWLADLGAEHGFTVSDHTVEVTGTCPDCRRGA
jgi:Fur family transcriptional regulator, ferric uptake regulator